MSKTSADIIVVGLGAMGSASLYQLARRGAKVLGIDQYHPPHQCGSSHGETRITRLAIGEGAIYTPLVLRSHEIWHELETATGQTLLRVTGGLTLASKPGLSQHHGKGDFLRRVITVAEQFGIQHEVLTADQISQLFPQLNLRGTEVGYYEPGAGYVMPECCISAQLLEAKRLGADYHTGETVLTCTPGVNGVRVETDRNVYEAEQVIVTAGPWLPRLLGGSYFSLLKVYRQVLYWFETSQPELFAPGRFPIVIWMHGTGDEDYLYAFPTPEGSMGVKVASESYGEDTSPSTVNRTVDESEIREMFEKHVQDRLNSITPRCVKASTCLYTVTPDADFIIDRHPNSERVIVASPCSGHGFKHSAAIGQGIAELVMDGESRFDLEPFSLQRFENR